MAASILSCIGVCYWIEKLVKSDKLKQKFNFEITPDFIALTEVHDFLLPDFQLRKEASLDKPLMEFIKENQIGVFGKW